MIAGLQPVLPDRQSPDWALRVRSCRVEGNFLTATAGPVWRLAVPGFEPVRGLEFTA